MTMSDESTRNLCRLEPSSKSFVPMDRCLGPSGMKRTACFATRRSVIFNY